MKTLTLQCPDWLTCLEEEISSARLTAPAEQMALANRLARLNIEQKTGGPFGALVVEMATGLVVGKGVNCVHLNGAIFHAETCAIWDAQCSIKSSNNPLGLLRGHALVTSSSPCAMCSGAVVWSGVSQLVTGATTDDVQSIVGFDEGPIHRDLQKELERRSITVLRQVQREECCAVLRHYAATGGIVYNGRQ